MQSKNYDLFWYMNPPSINILDDILRENIFQKPEPIRFPRPNEGSLGVSHDGNLFWNLKIWIEFTNIFQKFSRLKNFAGGENRTQGGV